MVFWCVLYPCSVEQSTIVLYKKNNRADDESLTDDHEPIESLHKKMPETSIPRVGMEFENKDAAYEFYNGYALVGFSLKVSCRQCKYRVTIFNAEHNHNLASPSKIHLFRSHRNVSTSQASVVDIADMSGIAPKNAYEFMAREANGRAHLGFAHVDIKNYLRTKHSSAIKSGETGGVLEYLQRMRKEDSGSSYAIQVDEDNLITNIFWADSTMIANVEDFGNVVCFDTTYRKHEDGRPVALFVGTTIFGVALLYDETADSFAWLFETFFRAMGEKLLKTILTDQDAAMAKALAAQWPQTNHRLCIRHIFRNATTHLAHKDDGG
ncbi:hypothetical protein V2J09_015681 [Rumex salicifolius]